MLKMGVFGPTLFLGMDLMSRYIEFSIILKDGAIEGIGVPLNDLIFLKNMCHVSL